MKTTIFLITAIVTIITISCSKSTDPVIPATASAAELKTLVTGSSWRITLFTERGTDKTSDFSSYLFEFKADGSMIANNLATTFSGTWGITQSNTKPDDSGHQSAPENKMNILVTGNKNMDDLSKNWKITTITGTEMWLTNDNPASAEEVRFSR